MRVGIVESFFASVAAKLPLGVSSRLLGAALLAGLGLSARPVAAQVPGRAWQLALPLHQPAGLVCGTRAIADAAGNTLVTGYFSGTVALGATTLVSAGGHDAFVAKLGADGRWCWAKAAGGPLADSGSEVALDTQGNVLLAGLFSATAHVGADSLRSAGGPDIFVAKLDPDGNWLWARAAGGTAHDQPAALVGDAQGGVTLAGYFAGAATFGPFRLRSGGGFDVFAACLNAAGTWRWARQATGASTGQATHLALDANGNVVDARLPEKTTHRVALVAQLARPLAVTAYSPAQAMAGTRVVLLGQGFVGVSSVRFNGIEASDVEISSPTQLSATVPAGASSGPVSVATAAGVASTAQSFEVPAEVLVQGPQTLRGTYGRLTVGSTGVATLGGDLEVVGTLTVAPGGQLHLGSYVVRGGSFRLADGGTLSLSHPAGLAATGPTGSVQTATRYFSSEANYLYYTTQPGSQTGLGLPARVRGLAVLGLPSRPLALTQDLAIGQVLRLAGTLASSGHTLTLLATPSFGPARLLGAGAVQGVVRVQRAGEATAPPTSAPDAPAAASSLAVQP